MAGITITGNDEGGSGDDRDEYGMTPAERRTFNRQWQEAQNENRAENNRRRFQREQEIATRRQAQFENQTLDARAAKEKSAADARARDEKNLARERARDEQILERQRAAAAQTRAREEREADRLRARQERDLERQQQQDERTLTRQRQRDASLRERGVTATPRAVRGPGDQAIVDGLSRLTPQDHEERRLFERFLRDQDRDERAKSSEERTAFSEMWKEAEQENKAFNARRSEQAREEARAHTTARRDADEEHRDRARSDPNTYFQRYIENFRGKAESATTSRDFTMLSKIESDLRTINATIQRRQDSGQMSAGEAERARSSVAEAQAAVEGGRATSRPGRGGFLGRMAGYAVGAVAPRSRMAASLAGEAETAGLTAGLARISPYLAVGKAALDLTKAAATSPITIGNTYREAAGVAEPYWNLQTGTSDVAREGNYYGGALQDRIYGNRPTEWMRRYGYNTDDVLRLRGEYGVSGRSAQNDVDIVRSIASARYMPNMGMSDDELARMAGQAQNLGISGSRPRISGADTGQSYDFRASEHDASRMAPNATNYFRQLQRIMTLATSEGLDHSRVAVTLGNLNDMASASGQATVNGDRSMQFAGQLMSSGAPGMRSGQGVLSMQAGMDSAVDSIGLGGDAARNNAMTSYFQRHGVPQSRGALAKMLHVNYDGLSPGAKANFDHSLDLARNGSSIMFAQSLAPFMKGNGSQFLQEAMGEYVDSLGPSYKLYRPEILGHLTNTTAEQQLDLSAGDRNLPLSEGASLGSMSEDTRRMVDDNSRQTGVPSALLASVWQHESGFNPSIPSQPDSGGRRGYGVGQVRQVALDDLHKSGYEKGVSLQDIANNPQIGARASAEYLSMLIRRNRGDTYRALMAYTGNNADEVSSIEKQVSSFQSGETNQTLGPNRARSDADYMGMRGSEQASNFAEGLSAATTTLSKWDTAVQKSTSAMLQAIANLNSMPTSMHPGMQRPSDGRLPRPQIP